MILHSKRFGPWSAFGWTLAVVVSACAREAEPVPCGDLGSGALVISEVVADPEGEDQQHEWVELYNPGAHEVATRGLRWIERSLAGVVVEEASLPSVTVAAGSWAVLGATDETPGTPLPSLRNAGFILELRCAERLIDLVEVSDTPSGTSWSLDGGVAPDALLNDDQSRWCAITEPTPAAPNPLCPVVSPPCAADGLTAPPGSLVVNEIHADPAATSDSTGEWVEILATSAVTAARLAVAVGSRRAEVEPCLTLAAGEIAVIARTLDRTANGGIDGRVLVAPLALANGGARLSLWSGERELDVVDYPRAKPGVAWSLDPRSASPSANDDPGSWCSATAEFGLGDRGTPGTANPPCTEAPQPLSEGACRHSTGTRSIVAAAPGDLEISEYLADPTSVTDSDGEWIELWAHRTVDLNGIELWINNEPRATWTSEDCVPLVAGTAAVVARDGQTLGGFVGPLLEANFSLPNTGATLEIRSASGATIDRVEAGAAIAGRAWQRSATGGVLVEPPEWCPALSPFGCGDRGSPGVANHRCGDCWDGVTTRAPRHPETGDLVITEIMADPAAVADTRGEWLEFLATTDVDLAGLTVVVNEAGRGSAPLDSCLAATAGSLHVVARSADPNVNGGLPVPDFLLSGLNNSGAAVRLEVVGNTIDAATYPTALAGIAYALSADRQSASQNDDPAAWCAATAAYGLGDLGTPGSANSTCP